MADTTANYALPYPESTDAPEVWTDMQNLAEAVDGALGDVDNTIGEAASLKPAGRIIASGTQSIPHNTATAIAFSGTDEIDTHGQHNPSSNNSRITPNVAGVYRFTGTLAMGGRADWTYIEAGFRKNGSAALPSYVRIQPGSNNTVRMVQVSVMQAMNGSTDYVELMALHLNAAVAAQVTNQSSQYSSSLEWERIRD
jgi:hypothetical protein